MGVRAEKRKRMESEILEAAMRAFTEGGIDGLTIASLAHEVGTSVGGIYRYFDGKDAILAALGHEALVGFDELQRHRLDALEARIKKAKARPDTAALARTIVAVETYLTHEEKYAGQHRLLDLLLSSPESLFDEESAPRVEAALVPILARTGQHLAAAAEAGALTAGDAALRTHALWAALHGVDHFRKRDRMQPRSLHADKIARLLCDSLLCGWGAEPAAIARARKL